MDNIEDLSKIREIRTVRRPEAVNKYLRLGWKVLGVEKTIWPDLGEVEVHVSFVLGYDVPDGEIPKPFDSWGAAVGAASGSE